MKVAKLLATVMLLIAAAHNVNATAYCNDDCEGQIATYINQKVALHGIPGISVIVTKNKQLALDLRDGVGSIEQQTPVLKSDAFRLYSATKIFVTVGIFQLVDEGMISLETSISEIIPDTPDNWKPIKLKHLLSHSSGIPDFIRIEGADKLSNEALWSDITSSPLDFDTGSRHSYNQTNYWILAKIIETLSEKSLQDYLIDKQFAGENKQIVFSSDDTAAIPGRLTKYYYDESDAIYRRSTFIGGSRGLAGNGISISTERLASWLVNFQAGKFLSADTKSKMLSPFNFKDSAYKFLHGLASYKSDNATAYGFSGGGVSAIRCWDASDLCIAVLTNGYKYYSVVNELIDQISWILEPSLKDDERQLLMTVSDRALSHQNQSLSATSLFDNDTPYSASLLTSFGYRMLYVGKQKLALDVFKKATREFPDEWNAFDSLGEAFATQGEYKQALTAYQKALALKEGDARIMKIIQGLKNKLE